MDVDGGEWRRPQKRAAASTTAKEWTIKERPGEDRERRGIHGLPPSLPLNSVSLPRHPMLRRQGGVRWEERATMDSAWIPDAGEEGVDREEGGAGEKGRQTAAAGNPRMGARGREEEY